MCFFLLHHTLSGKAFKPTLPARTALGIFSAAGSLTFSSFEADANTALLLAVSVHVDLTKVALH